MGTDQMTEGLDTPMRLTRDCTCPRCGFKTMASRCRKCGQRIMDDERIAGTFSIFEGGRLVFNGTMADACKLMGIKYNTLRARVTRFGRWTENGRTIVDDRMAE